MGYSDFSLDIAVGALRAIRGPEDTGPWMAVYRGALGGYGGLQAIADHALTLVEANEDPARPASPRELLEEIHAHLVARGELWADRAADYLDELYLAPRPTDEQQGDHHELGT